MSPTTPNRAELGRKIRDMRFKAGASRGRKMGQQELADLVSEGKSTISNWERGLYVDAQKVALVEAVLGISSGMPLPADLPDEPPTVGAALAHVRAAYDILRALEP